MSSPLSQCQPFLCLHFIIITQLGFWTWTSGEIACATTENAKYRTMIIEHFAISISKVVCQKRRASDFCIGIYEEQPLSFCFSGKGISSGCSAYVMRRRIITNKDFSILWQLCLKVLDQLSWVEVVCWYENGEFHYQKGIPTAKWKVKSRLNLGCVIGKCLWLSV